MALNAPFHLQRGNLRDEWHLIDAAMARRAADALRDMDRVIEINVVRQVVDAVPVNRDARLPAIAHRRKVGRRREQLRVAVHAGLDRGHSSGRTAFDGRVAIAAVDAIIADVMLVAELNRLRLDGIRLIPIRRARQAEKNIIDSERRKRAGPDDRSPRNRVRTLIKNLPHQEK